MNAALERMMDFDLSEEQRLVRKTVREFAEAEILPYVEEYEKQERYPTELVAKLPALGLMGPMIPEEYGGSFSDVLTYGVICEELARVDWVVASVVSVANSLCGGSILRHGTDAQKQRYLPGIASGDIICSACLTEPRGGTDLGNMDTTAKQVDGGYLLNGTKVFISHAEHAGLFFIVASIDRSKKHKGVTAFVADPREMKGLTIGEFPMRTLKRDNLAEVHFEDVFVPDEAVLGQPGGGFPILGSALDLGRFSVAARCVGQSQRAIDLTAPYAMDREAFGQPIGEFQAIQFMLADMQMQTEAARCLLYDCTRMADAQDWDGFSAKASMVKCYASDVAMKVATDAVQVFGGAGYMRDFPVERYMRDAKINQIFEGTNQIQRLVISRKLAR